jgi:hypothetical protein
MLLLIVARVSISKCFAHPSNLLVLLEHYQVILRTIHFQAVNLMETSHSSAANFIVSNFDNDSLLQLLVEAAMKQQGGKAPLGNTKEYSKGGAFGNDLLECTARRFQPRSSWHRTSGASSNSAFWSALFLWVQNGNTSSSPYWNCYIHHSVCCNALELKARFTKSTARLFQRV